MKHASIDLRLRGAVFSPCRRYRYALWREWNGLFVNDPESTSSYLMVIGLNPSTADETTDDPTIRRCVGFAKRWRYPSLCMTNLFAWRATKVSDMKAVDNPTGIENQHYLLTLASGAGMVLAAWGKDGSFRQQDLTVRQWLSGIGIQLYCLKKNKDGSPMHPLYVKADTAPIPYP